MILTNEFTVGADLEKVWEQLLDVEAVAQCVPGAKIEQIEPPNIYKGTIRVRVGPMTVDYRGQAVLEEMDETTRTAVIRLRAREAKGHGTAAAVVRNHLESVPGGTRVVAETDLQITGPQAQFGRGVLEDVGSRVLEEFASRLEKRLLASDDPASSGGVGAGDGRYGGESPDDDVLDLGKIVSKSMGAKALKFGGAAALVAIVLVWLMRRCQSGV
ncbi:MAG: SRPBCC family protein [Acidimicrobiales bacterium]